MTTRTLRGALAMLLAIGASAMAPVAEAKVPRFYPGDHVVLVLRDSSRVSGKFVDLGRVSVEAYRDRYHTWRESSAEAGRLPELGERVELGTGRITSSGKVSFVGLGHEGVEVRRSDGATRTVPFSNFSNMVLSGARRLESGWIRRQCEGGAPLVTTIEVAVPEGTRIVAFDDVLGVESSPKKGPIETGPASFSSESSVSKWVASVQAGGLWAVDSEYGVVARGLAWRISPSFVVPRIGVDFLIGFLQDDESDGGGLDLQLALCGTLPVGSRLGIAPRLGVGIIAGAGLGVPITTIGTGVMLRLDRNVGFRADYTFEHLVGTGYNYDGISEFHLGVYWGR